MEKMATKKLWNLSRIRLFHHHTQTGSDEPAPQTDVYDHAARKYR